MREDLLKNNKGFTLVEVLIAIALLAVALLALGTLATSNIKTVELSKRQTQAINLATEKIEVLEVIPFNLVGRNHGGTSTVDGNSIERVCEAPFLNANARPFITCEPVESVVTINNLDFNWMFTVTYLNFDNDANDYSNEPNIDSGDIKKVEVVVYWTDIYGMHTTSLAGLRGKST